MKSIVPITKSVFFLCAFFFFLNVQAQAPTRMSYQAVIRNASNNLVANSTVTIQISILQNSTSGTVVYAERHMTETNANGLITIVIGSGGLSVGNFSNINWANGPFFLKSETDPNGGTNFTITATSQLMSVPYALFAKEAANTWSTNGNTIGSAETFLGTNDDKDLVFRRNSLTAGRIGFLNTAFGEQALEGGGTSTTFNTAIGVRTMASPNMSGGSNTALGANALGGVSSGSANVALGRNSLLANTTGRDNVAVGMGALSSGSGGINNIGIGRDTQVSTVGASNQIRMGNTAVTFAAVQVAWTVTSDRKWKSNIRESNLGLDFIKDLKPVVYTRKDVELEGEKYVLTEKTSNLTTEYGFIAQELEETLLKFDAKDNGIISKDDNGMYGVRYNDLIAPMVKAMQEQQSIIDTQVKTINEMMKRLEAIENKK